MDGSWPHINAVLQTQNKQHVEDVFPGMGARRNSSDSKLFWWLGPEDGKLVGTGSGLGKGNTIQVCWLCLRGVSEDTSGAESL